MTTESITSSSVPEDAGARLLGLLALAELTLYLRLTAALAEVGDPVRALRVAAAATRHLQRAEQFTARLQTDAGSPDGMAPWRPTVDGLTEIRANDWLEGMVGAHVVGGVLGDLAALLPASDESAVRADAGDLAAAVREATDLDPALVGRLSLFGRRVFGRVLLAARDVVARVPESERPLIRDYFEGAGDIFAERMTAMGLKG